MAVSVVGGGRAYSLRRLLPIPLMRRFKPTVSAPAYCYDYPRPGLTADTVAFREDVETSGLAVLLIKRQRSPFQGEWALPGGFVEQHEDLALAAARELSEETRISDVPLVQIGAFGRPYRDPRGHSVTTAFLAAVPSGKADLAQAGDDAAEARWVSLRSLPVLAFDHAEILRETCKVVAKSSVLGDRDAIKLFDHAGFEMGSSALALFASDGYVACAEAWAQVAAMRALAGGDGALEEVWRVEGERKLEEARNFALWVRSVVAGKRPGN